MRTRRIDNTRLAAAGFALVEVLIAIFILAIGMISVATIFPVAIHQSRQATDDIVGQMVGEQALALLRTKGVTTVAITANEVRADGNLVTRNPGGFAAVVEGFVDNGFLQFGLSGKDESQGLGRPPGWTGSDPPGTILTFGIPPSVPNEPPPRIWANEMIWPATSGFPDLSKPAADRRFDFPETERHPQYAWKVVLFKPEVSAPITATILVYRVSNWEAFWNWSPQQRWQGIFPDLSRTRLGLLMPGIVNGTRTVTPGDIFIKADAVLRPPAPAEEIGTAWRITRTRPNPASSSVSRDIGGENARAFASLLPDGAIYSDVTLMGNPLFLHLPATDVGRFRPVAVVTGAIDR